VATFTYSARDRSGQLIKGVKLASGESELRRSLKDDGLFLVKAKGQKPASTGRGRGKIKPKELILFTFNLQNVMDSGVPLLNGLEDMKDSTKDARFRAVIGDIIDNLTAGETFTQALKHHPTVFDSLYVNMCEAGELSGRLPDVLARVVQFLEWREDFKHQIKDLVMYPIVVFVALIGLVGLVIGFVFPRFAEVFTRVKFELPWSTKFLMGASDFLTTHWWHLILGAAVVWGIFFTLGRIDRVRLAFDTWWLKVPVVGELITMLNFSQVAQSLGSFMDSGIAIPRAMEMIEKIVPNRRVSLSVRNAREAIMGGETLSGALRGAALFPPLILRMVAMGEQSGRLVESLEKTSKIYDREIPQKTKQVIDILNPMLTMLMGGMLFFVILSVMMPLYKMYEEIGKNY
jgi:type IV pilus assembly protein PilC